jgi:hypothetical protein
MTPAKPPRPPKKLYVAVSRLYGWRSGAYSSRKLCECVYEGRDYDVYTYVLTTTPRAKKGKKKP